VKGDLLQLKIASSDWKAYEKNRLTFAPLPRFPGNWLSPFLSKRSSSRKCSTTLPIIWQSASVATLTEVAVCLDVGGGDAESAVDASTTLLSGKNHLKHLEKFVSKL